MSSSDKNPQRITRLCIHRISILGRVRVLCPYSARSVVIGHPDWAVEDHVAVCSFWKLMPCA